MKLPTADCRLPIARRGVAQTFLFSGSGDFSAFAARRRPVASRKWQKHGTGKSREPAGWKACATHGSAAFTLIEIMIAVVLFSMVIAAIFATWALIMRATTVGQEAAERAQRQRVVLRAIGDAVMGIASFQASQTPQQSLYYIIMENGQSPVLSFVSHLPDTFPRNNKFVGETAIRDADGHSHGLDASLRRVTFTLDSDNNLILRQNPVLMDMDDDEQKYPLVLAKNVKEFTIEWWGTNEMNQVGWFKERDQSLSNNIPPMLRVHLVLGANAEKGDNAPNFTATRIYTVPSQMMPAFLQHGMGPGGPGGLHVPTLPIQPSGGQNGGRMHF